MRVTIRVRVRLRLRLSVMEYVCEEMGRGGRHGEGCSLKLNV